MVQLVHVGYAEEREDLFIMALPATKVRGQAWSLCPYNQCYNLSLLELFGQAAIFL